MAKKTEGGGGGGKTKSNRTSRFSLRQFLASTNILTGASNANIPLPAAVAASSRTKEYNAHSYNKRRHCKQLIMGNYFFDVE